jgi:hypothetical protein
MADPVAHTSTSSIPDPGRSRDDKPDVRPTVLSTWAWFLAKNAIGWLLIVSSFVLGPLVPGPGGIPLFLIGFGLITFPGKRKLVARMFRGKPIPRGSFAYLVAIVALSLVLPAATMVFLIKRGWITNHYDHESRVRLTWIYAGSFVVMTLLGLWALPLVNRALAKMSVMRRKVRPWLRRKGIDLLPARRRRRMPLQHGHRVRQADPEIMEIHERHVKRMRRWWKKSLPWVRPLFGLFITVAIFTWIFKPIVREWPTVRASIATIHFSHFLLAAAIFALFLFAFRTMLWRRILIAFGCPLPVVSAIRIWSTSEFARYLPGMIWQVVGRAYLARPYGVRATYCSASQVLELVIFLLANLLVAIACLLWLGIRNVSGAAEVWLYVALGIVPVLILVLHPRVLYRMMNSIFRKFKKPELEPRMGFRALAGLLLWTMLGLCVQSLAIWLLVQEPLGGLPIRKWWVVAGAYCLAWCAGFLAFWAPGGLGVRELVFVAALRVALPPSVQQRFEHDPQHLLGVIMFLSVLLRLWVTAGELILTGVGYAMDWKGALQRNQGQDAVASS